jgi:chemotaxis protein histidine kinase CheA
VVVVHFASQPSRSCSNTQPSPSPLPLTALAPLSPPTPTPSLAAMYTVGRTTVSTAAKAPKPDAHISLNTIIPTPAMLDHARKEAAHAQARADKLQTQLDAAARERDAFEDAAARERALRDALEHAAARERDRVTEQFTKSNQQTFTLEKELAVAEKKIAEQQQELDHIKQALREANELVDALRDDSSAARAAEKDKIQRLEADRNKHRDSAKRRLERLKKQTVEHTTTKDKLMTQIEALKIARDAAVAKAAEAEARRVAAEADEAAAQEKVTFLETACADMRGAQPTGAPTPFQPEIMQVVDVHLGDLVGASDSRISVRVNVNYAFGTLDVGFQQSPEVMGPLTRKIAELLYEYDGAAECNVRAQALARLKAAGVDVDLYEQATDEQLSIITAEREGSDDEYNATDDDDY